MNQKPLRSEFVQRVMPNATPEEIEDATRRWFAVLNILYRADVENSDTEFDSRDSQDDDTLEANQPPL